LVEIDFEIGVKSEAGRESTEELTAGQMHMWEYHAVGDLMAFSFGVLLKQGIPLAQVLRIISRVVGDTETLRTVFPTEDGGVPKQVLRRAVAIPLEVVRDGGDVSGRVAAVSEAMTAKRMSIECEIPVRFAAVVSRADSVKAVVVAVSHIAVDRAGLGMVRRRFEALLASGGGADPYLAEQGRSRQPVDQVCFERSDVGRNRQLRAAKYLARYYEAAGALDVDRNRYIGTEPRYCRLELRGSSAGISARRTAEVFGVSPQALLLARAASAVGSLVGADGVPLRVVSGNRFDPETKWAIGTFAQEVPVYLPLYGDSRERVGRTFDLATRAYMAAGLHPKRRDRVRCELSSRGLECRNPPFVFNSHLGMERYDGEASEDGYGPTSDIDPKHPHFVWTRRWDTPSPALYIYVLSDFTLGVDCDSRFVSQREAESLLGLIAGVEGIG
jgi:hypothetical protein